MCNKIYNLIKKIYIYIKSKNQNIYYYNQNLLNIQDIFLLDKK